VVPVYDAGEEHGHLYLAMQLINGPDLQTLVLRERGLNPQQVADYVRQIASALDASHAAGVIHRDVKPANILVEGTHAWLSDFGLSRSQHLSSTPPSRPGTVVGTAGFVAPEQVEGNPAGPQSDLYGLACTAFYALTRRAPFEAATAMELLWAHVEEQPPTATSVNAALPHEVDAVFGRALEKNPDARQATTSEFALELSQALTR
jgi:serine/threonine-protein kinase